MQVICPHCHNPLDLGDGPAPAEVYCPACGSGFRLEANSTTAWQGSGDKLGRFRLIEVLGQGAFGTVYRARDPELDRTVAIKVPRAGSVAGQKESERFLREARSAAQLRHPSIVTVHEVGQAESLPYLVSDFVPGVTLADLLSARRPGFRASAELVAAPVVMSDSSRKLDPHEGHAISSCVLSFTTSMGLRQCGQRMCMASLR